jgi:hypothetical protein
MKPLSILILLGTLTALVIGGLFAVTPALADNSPKDITNQAFVEAPAAAEAVVENAPVAPTTGQVIPLELAETNTEEPGLVLGSAFSTEFGKDSAALEIQQAAAPAGETQAAPIAANNLESFIGSVQNGDSGQIVGIYSEGTLAFQVSGQPSGNAGYVSNGASEVTRFGLASQYGSKGFLAHNYLAGANFFDLNNGDIITLVYGDGSTQDYRIQVIRSFQALQPNSTQSNFVDLDNGGNLSASELFYQIYNSDNPVVLQTCIANEGISTWGRLFVIAVPVS